MKLKFAFLNLLLGSISLLIINTKFTSYSKAEDGIRDRSPSRGLGDVYKRQFHNHLLDHKSSKLKRHLSTKAVVDERDADNVKLMIPYA